MENLFLAVFGGLFMIIIGIAGGAVRTNTTKTLIFGMLLCFYGIIGFAGGGNIFNYLCDNTHSAYAVLINTAGTVFIISFLCIPLGFGAVIGGCLKLLINLTE